MKVIRRSAYVPAAWKNGGGTTFEVARAPAEADPFDWRLSIARIEVPGSFSDFLGFERTMVLLDGRGLRLEFEGRAPAELSRAGDMVRFGGSPAPYCRLSDGPCTDLNLIVSARLPSARAEVWRGSQTRDPWLSCADGETLILVLVNGALALQADASDPVHLEPWDTAILSRGDRVRWRDTGAERPTMFQAAVRQVITRAP